MKEAARPVMLIETASDTLIGIFESELRTALASIPEMPHVDLGHIEKIVRAIFDKGNDHGLGFDVKKEIEIAGFVIQLTSPPTKTE